MAAFCEKGAFAAVLWVVRQARVVADWVRSGLERFYRQAWEAESLRQSHEISLFGWSITIDVDGTALAENHLTGEMVELDAEQVADVRRAASFESVPRRQG